MESASLLLSTVSSLHSVLITLYLVSYALEGTEQSSNSLGIIIFFAILLHKLPASVGLGSFLKGEGVGMDEAFFSILSFTLSSPISSIFFFILLSLMPDYKQSMPIFLSIVLLISAGTFLYVATIHILPTSLSKSTSKLETVFLGFGIMLPYLLHAAIDLD